MVSAKERFTVIADSGLLKSLNETIEYATIYPAFNTVFYSILGVKFQASDSASVTAMELCKPKEESYIFTPDGMEIQEQFFSWKWDRFTTLTRRDLEWAIPLGLLVRKTVTKFPVYLLREHSTSDGRLAILKYLMSFKLAI